MAQDMIYNKLISKGSDNVGQPTVPEGLIYLPEISGTSSWSRPTVNVASSNNSQNYNYGPIPYPTYDSILSGGGSVHQRPTLGGGASITQEKYGLPTELTLHSQYNDQYMNELYGYASSDSPSPWLTNQLENITSYGKTAGDTMTAQQAGSVAQAQEALAMRGGIDSGAAERLQQAGIDSRMMGGQTLARDVEEQRRQMRIAEEASKLGVLQAMPGMEAQRAAYESELQQNNISDILAERDRERQAQLDKYGIQMNAWAAEQQARATLAKA